MATTISQAVQRELDRIFLELLRSCDASVRKARQATIKFFRPKNEGVNKTYIDVIKSLAQQPDISIKSFTEFEARLARHLTTNRTKLYYLYILYLIMKSLQRTLDIKSLNKKLKFDTDATCNADLHALYQDIDFTRLRQLLTQQSSARQSQSQKKTKVVDQFIVIPSIDQNRVQYTSHTFEKEYHDLLVDRIIKIPKVEKISRKDYCSDINLFRLLQTWEVPFYRLDTTPFTSNKYCGGGTTRLSGGGGAAAAGGGASNSTRLSGGGGGAASHRDASMRQGHHISPDYFVLYHGTSQKHARSILNQGASTSVSYRALFGKGFYVTPEIAIANEFAEQASGEASLLGKRPRAIIQFTINTDDAQKMIGDLAHSSDMQSQTFQDTTVHLDFTYAFDTPYIIIKNHTNFLKLHSIIYIDT